MGIEDNKTFSLNISLRQIVAIIAIFVLCVVAIYLKALTVGYVIVTLVLCAFFLAVAFDFGVTKRVVDGPGPNIATATEPPRPSKRSARTV
jgi:heme O synthase-like polyprenyltransferase